MSATKIFSVLFTVSLLCLNAQAAEVCTEDEIKEAEFAFRNCEDSAKATIFSKAAKPDDDLCQILTNLFSGCTDQLETLAECKGSEHVKDIKKISRQSMAMILDQTRPGNTGTKASLCPILLPPTTTTTTTTTTSKSTVASKQAPQTSASDSHHRANLFCFVCLMTSLLTF